MDHQVQQVHEALLDKQRFVIVSHIRPDGDAIGSTVGMGLYLKGLGKEVRMFNSDPPPANIEWLYYDNGVEEWEGSVDQLLAVGQADAILIMDVNAGFRMGNLEGPVKESPATKILIDHHPGPEDWFDMAYARTEASSTGELVYDLIEKSGTDVIDDKMGKALYAAIMTDTGSFRFNNVTPRVHRIVADLMSQGNFNPERIHIDIFNNRREAGLRLLGAALDSMTTIMGGKVGYMVVTRSMLGNTGARIDDTEGFVDYVLSIEGVEAGVLFLDLNQHTKMSFRSHGDVAVNEWAKHFGGGGHRNASGAYVKGRIDKILPRVLDAAPDYLPFEDV